MTSKHPLQRNTTLFTFLTAASLVILTSLWMIGPYLLSILMAAVLTRFSQPSYSKLLKRGMRPRIAAAILTFALVLLVITPLSLFLNIAIRQAIGIAGTIAQNDALSPQVLIDSVGNLRLMDVLGVSPEDFSVRAHEWIQSAISSVTELALRWLTLLPEIILQIVLTCIAYFFILVDGKSFLAWMSCRIPFDKDVSDQVFKSFEDTAIASILATISAGVAQACVLFTGFLILGVPGAFLAGGATFIFSWIPLLGTTPVWIVGALYLFFQAYLRSPLETSSDDLEYLESH